MIINPSQIASNTIIKRNDTQRSLIDNLTVGGVPLNLTSASVFIIMHDLQTDTATKYTASIDNAGSGSVSFPLSASVATAGDYLCEWEVILSSSLAITLPTEGYNKLKILPDLA